MMIKRDEIVKMLSESELWEQRHEDIDEVVFVSKDNNIYLDIKPLSMIITICDTGMNTRLSVEVDYSELERENLVTGKALVDEHTVNCIIGLNAEGEIND